MNHELEESIFAAAIEIESDAKRSQFLEQACGSNAELKKSVEELLANAKSDSLFDNVTRTIDGDRTHNLNIKQLGDFRILRELGRGGMGVVYEAHQKSLNRKVALKVLSAGLGLTTRAIMRFRREAEAAGKLHHTNIVPIYSTGEEKGVHYYAMELVDGPSLDQVIGVMRGPGLAEEQLHDGSNRLSEEHVGSTGDELLDETADAGQKNGIPDWVGKKLSFPDSSKGASQSSTSLSGTTAGGCQYFASVAKMIADAADALEHAHDHGVIHRDIKPSNLLLGPDGRLSINDFGLARVLEQPGMTISGEIMGTPRYMSPEQISAGRSKLDHRTDIYSLGATLYELLTLEPPFDGVSRDEVIGQILHKEPKAARKINARIPKDLETICMAAIERDPDRRYQTAGLLAEDLRRFVDGRTPDKKRVGLAGKTVRWVKRHPSRAALIAVSLFSIFAFLVFWQVNRQFARETAMKDAFNYSIIGEYEKANEKLELASSLGASEGWQNLILGQIELFKGNNSVALDHLKKVDIDELKIQAECLRILLHFRCHDEAAYLKEIQFLQRMIDGKATSGLDDLYLGMVYSWGLPEKAIEYLDVATEKNAPKGAVLAYRSIALCNVALNTRNSNLAISHAKNAVECSTIASSIFGDNSFSDSMLSTAHLVLAIVLHRYDSNDAESAIDKAKSLCEHLDLKYPRDNDFLVTKFFYLREFEPVEAPAYLNRLDGDLLLDPLLNSRIISSICFANSLPEDDFAKLQYKNYHQPIFFLSQIFRGRDLREVREGYQMRLLNYPADPNLGVQWDWAVCKLLQIDPKAKGVNRSIEYVAREYTSSFTSKIHQILIAIDNGVSIKELLENADNRQELSTIYFYVGIRELAKDDLPRAQEMFEEGAKEGFFYFYNTHLCSVLAKKLAEPGFEESWKKRMALLDQVD